MSNFVPRTEHKPLVHKKAPMYLAWLVGAVVLTWVVRIIEYCIHLPATECMSSGAPCSSVKKKQKMPEGGDIADASNFQCKKALICRQTAA